jgi:hypothetical protein
MAELTNLETKLGEVMGLAMAAQAATEKVRRLVEDEHPEYVDQLERMHRDAVETEQRCARITDTFEGKKTAINDEAAATKRKGAEMMKIYLDADSDALDGFEFLTMAEAGEVGHWNVLASMNRGAARSDVAQLCDWAIPIQNRHFVVVTEASQAISKAEDPAAIAS